MKDGTAYIGIKSPLTCFDETCRIMGRDDGTVMAVGVFNGGKLTNIRCIYCRGPIKEAPELLKNPDLEYTME